MEGVSWWKSHVWLFACIQADRLGYVSVGRDGPVGLLLLLLVQACCEFAVNVSLLLQASCCVTLMLRGPVQCPGEALLLSVGHCVDVGRCWVNSQC
jgi:hypothetical protein